MNDRYSYFFTPNKVICVSSYAGRKVRGVAICSPDDQFDPEIGMKLARARCDVKIARKRYERAGQKFDEALVQSHAVDALCRRMADYYNDSFRAYNDATQDLKALEASL